MNFWHNLGPVFITLSNFKNLSDQFLKPFLNELEKKNAEFLINISRTNILKTIRDSVPVTGNFRETFLVLVSPQKLSPRISRTTNLGHGLRPGSLWNLGFSRSPASKIFQHSVPVPDPENFARIPTPEFNYYSNKKT